MEREVLLFTSCIFEELDYFHQTRLWCNQKRERCRNTGTCTLEFGGQAAFAQNGTSFFMRSFQLESYGSHCACRYLWLMASCFFFFFRFVFIFNQKQLFSWENWHTKYLDFWLSWGIRNSGKYQASLHKHAAARGWTREQLHHFDKCVFRSATFSPYLYHSIWMISVSL